MIWIGIITMAYLNKMTLYMKEEDHQLLKERAKKAGMSVSSYVRKKCLEEKKKKRGLSMKDLFVK